MKDGINVLSLFNDMGCIWLALDNLGIKVNKRYSSEIDKWAILVNDANYPDTIQLGDVTEIDGTLLEDIDLIVGGSPCQGFSLAGKQLDFEDPRSKLFFEFTRLLEETKAPFFLLENVRMKKESEDVITGELMVAPVKINSLLVSAQNRHRVYWTNLPEVEQPVDLGLVLKDIMEPEEDILTKYYVTDRFNAKVPGTLAYKKARVNIRTPDRKSKTLTTGGHCISNSGSTNIKLPDGRIRIPAPVECERLQTVPDNYTDYVSNRQRYRMLGNGWTVDVISHLLEPLTLYV